MQWVGFHKFETFNSYSYNSSLFLGAKDFHLFSSFLNPTKKKIIIKLLIYLKFCLIHYHMFFSNYPSSPSLSFRFFLFFQSHLHFCSRHLIHCSFLLSLPSIFSCVCFPFVSVSTSHPPFFSQFLPLLLVFCIFFPCQLFP